MLKPALTDVAVVGWFPLLCRGNIEILIFTIHYTIFSFSLLYIINIIFTTSLKWIWSWKFIKVTASKAFLAWYTTTYSRIGSFLVLAQPYKLMARISWASSSCMCQHKIDVTHQINIGHCHRWLSSYFADGSWGEYRLVTVFRLMQWCIPLGLSWWLFLWIKPRTSSDLQKWTDCSETIMQITVIMIKYKNYNPAWWYPARSRHPFHFVQSYAVFVVSEKERKR